MTAPSTQIPPTPPEASARLPAVRFSPGQRVFLVAANYLPFLNLLILACILWLSARGIWPRWTWVLAPAWLLLVPPVVVRLTLALFPLPQTDIRLGSRPFFVWWFTSQWQVIFNRLPIIEEMLRLVPALYGAWLRLWGGKIGTLIYWTPGLRILDRSMLAIGDRVVFGAGVKINPHILMPDAEGRLVLRAATIHIGADALVGGYSLLLAGCWIAAGEISPGKREFRPFTGWLRGRRVDSAFAPEVDDE